MDISTTERRAAARAHEQSAAAPALVPKLTDEFLDTPALVVAAMDGEDQANGIAFALVCHELAGKEPPDFGSLSEDD